MDNERCWPVRPRPERDELLFSWLRKLSRDNGQKLLTFYNRAPGSKQQQWNRDIDRLVPKWLLAELSQKTALPLSIIENTTFIPYRGKLFRVQGRTGLLPWILPLQVYHYDGPELGLQYCAQCLAQDREPYFRRRWRVAYYTFCPDHNTLLHDRCFRCKAAISLHGQARSRSPFPSISLMSICCNCGCDIRSAPARTIPIYNVRSHRNTIALLKSLESNHHDNPGFGLTFHDTLHHVCKLIASDNMARHIEKAVWSQMNWPESRVARGRLALELRSLRERHTITALAIWILTDMHGKLAQVWNGSPQL